MALISRITYSGFNNWIIFLDKFRILIYKLDNRSRFRKNQPQGHLFKNNNKGENCHTRLELKMLFKSELARALKYYFKIKPSCHIQFLLAIIVLRCVFEVLTLVDKNKQSNSKMQYIVEYTCLYGMCKLECHKN